MSTLGEAVGRPLIDFLQTDDVPAQQVRLPGADRPCRLRELSCDPLSGERSLVLELPPDWCRATNDGALDHDEELFVLSGDLDDDGDQLPGFSYVFRAAGRPRGRTRSHSGARVLVFERPGTEKNYRPER